MGPGSFAGSTRAGRSAKRMRQAGPDVRERSARIGCGAGGGVRRSRGLNGWRGCRRGRGHIATRGSSSGEVECGRVGVREQPECAERGCGTLQGCPAVGAPSGAPASVPHGASERAPPSPGRRARRFVTGSGRTRGINSPGTQGVWWTDRTAEPSVRGDSQTSTARGSSRGAGGSTRKMKP